MRNILLKAKAAEVASMDENELYAFGAEVDMSMLDARSKEYLYRSIELRLIELEEQKKIDSAKVVNSEIKEG